MELHDRRFTFRKQRREFGVVWTRGLDRKRNLCWRSPKRLRLTVTRERVRVGTVGALWLYCWVARDGGSQFFSSMRLRHAFLTAANHARVCGRL